MARELKNVEKKTEKRVAEGGDPYGRKQFFAMPVGAAALGRPQSLPLEGKVPQCAHWGG